jgi:uncharacterized protein (TIGR03067 family)
LTLRGNHYDFSSSKDGETFVAHGELPWGEGAPGNIGLLATNGGTLSTADIEACFDFFEIRALTPGEADEPRFAERRGLAGPWDVVACQIGGKMLEETAFTGFSFSDTRVTVREKQKALELDYALDLSEEPKRLTLSGSLGRGGGPLDCIYSRTGDTLKICLNLQPGMAVPTKFEAGEGDGRMLLTLNRAPSEK